MGKETTRRVKRADTNLGSATRALRRGTRAVGFSGSAAGRRQAHFFFTGRFQPRTVTCLARATVSCPGGTSRVTVEPAPTVAPAPTVIGDDAHTGSNSVLVAPITVGAGATVGAGSTVTREVPAGQLTVARAKQVTVRGWKRPVRKK